MWRAEAMAIAQPVPATPLQRQARVTPIAGGVRDTDHLVPPVRCREANKGELRLIKANKAVFEKNIFFFKKSHRLKAFGSLR
jgi:hypothetical protein